MFRSAKDLDRLLRGEATQPQMLRAGTVDVSASGLVILIILLGMFYGLCMGVYALLADDGPRYMQAVASAVKVPALFLLTLAVTFPSLYVFNALVGSRLTLPATLRLLLAALGVMLAVLASLGPIVAFFSLSTTSYAFMQLLNVAIFAVSGLLGLGFLLQTLHRLSLAQMPASQPARPVAAEIEMETTSDTPEAVSQARRSGALDRLDDRAVDRPVKAIFRIWIIVFGLVGAQMAWIMRPFLGHPRAKEFVWFRERGESNFFQAVAEAIRNLFGN